MTGDEGTTYEPPRGNAVRKVPGPPVVMVGPGVYTPGFDIELFSPCVLSSPCFDLELLFSSSPPPPFLLSPFLCFSASLSSSAADPPIPPLLKDFFIIVFPLPSSSSSFPCDGRTCPTDEMEGCTYTGRILGELGGFCD